MGTADSLVGLAGAIIVTDITLKALHKAKITPKIEILKTPKIKSIGKKWKL